MLRKQHTKQMDIYSRMIAAQKKDKILKEGGIMKLTAAIMQKALKITTLFTKNEKRDRKLPCLRKTKKETYQKN